MGENRRHYTYFPVLQNDAVSAFYVYKNNGKQQKTEIGPLKLFATTALC